ncbi:MAG TPA: 30S ribosomal protein S6--L-glutamate ligase, partial [Nitrospiria bacterium]|nr:30S ribosomal protein S6--L-glutamate ligase [Nitrospiria bacterium]
GHKAEVIDVLKCYVRIEAGKPVVFDKDDRLLNNFDAVIPRIGASITFYGTAIVRQFEMAGTYTLNDSLGITRSRDKLRAHQMLSRKKIGMPVTGFAHSPKNTDALIKNVGGTPLVVKLLEGTQGKGIILVETKKAAESLIEAFRGLNAFFLVQEYIEEAGGADIRCFVVGERVVAAMMRKAQPGEFRSNLHRGGVTKLVKLTPEERRTAVAAANAMGLRVAGVDMVRSDRGPLVLEVNSSPGLEGIETATGKDVAGEIIEFTTEHARPTTHTRGTRG